MVSHLILIQSGEPASLDRQETDLTAESMHQADNLGRQLAERQLLPAPAVSFGLGTCQVTAKIMLRAAQIRQPQVPIYGRLARLEEHPLHPASALLGQSFSRWLDQEMADFVHQQSAAIVLIVAPAMLVAALDQLTAVERPRATYRPCEGLRLMESFIHGHFVAVEPLGVPAERRWPSPSCVA